MTDFVEVASSVWGAGEEPGSSRLYLYLCIINLSEHDVAGRNGAGGRRRTDRRDGEW